MRQVLEAFATFQFKKDIAHVSTDPQILSLLKEPEYISYFEKNIPGTGSGQWTQFYFPLN